MLLVSLRVSLHYYLVSPTPRQELLALVFSQLSCKLLCCRLESCTELPGLTGEFRPAVTIQEEGEAFKYSYDDNLKIWLPQQSILQAPAFETLEEDLVEIQQR